MGIDRHDPRPPYVQVADALRQQVETGQLPAGEKLPSLRELAASYRVAQMTVQNALRLLRAEGVVVTYAGRGTFVRRSGEPAETPDDPVLAELVQMRAALRELRERIERRELQAESDIRSLTQRVVSLERTYGSAGEP